MRIVAFIIDLAQPLRREFIEPTPTGATAVRVAHFDPVVSAKLVAILMGTRDFRVTALDRADSSLPGPFIDMKRERSFDEVTSPMGIEFSAILRFERTLK